MLDGTFCADNTITIMLLQFADPRAVWAYPDDQPGERQYSDSRHNQELYSPRITRPEVQCYYPGSHG